uniref:Small GTP-binding protein domain-containing protein n=1 Tax=Candidatus Kentrum sp. TUN TaxID=2126343 RepID=A0A450ZE49_9GAMM|nr:MAG: small GTP-binding protein domain-containing protein [Candidatus Kentron sp. TUN]
MAETKKQESLEIGQEAAPGMRLRAICQGHTETIGCMAWSPCGRFLASPSGDITIRIWNAEEGRCLAVLEGHNSRFLCVAWSADGEYLVSGDVPGKLYLWRKQGNPGSEDAYGLVERFQGHERMIHSVDWSPRQPRFASGSRDNRIRIWDITSGGVPEPVVVLEGHSNSVFAVSWSGDGKYLASASWDNTVRIWDAATGQRLKELQGHTAYVLSVAWSPDDSLLASAGNDQRICIWSVQDGREKYVLEGHTSPVVDVAFSRDGNLLASCSHDNTVRLWRTDDWSEVVSVDCESDDINLWRSLAFRPVGSSMLATLGENDRAVYLWDMDSDALLQRTRTGSQVRYTSAKVVLVGESNVGKSCLAMRMAEGRYPEDHKLGTTHGMKFWPMEAAALHESASPPPKQWKNHQRRDVVLWDFGGQDEYQLVHQLFLHDTTLALVLIDPTRGHISFDQARDWNKRLERHLRHRKAVKLLVGAKQDQASELVDRKGVEALCQECGFAGYLETSAKLPRGIEELKAAIADRLDWEGMARTSRPELFQRIRDEVELRREAGDVVVLLAEMAAGIRENRSLTEPPKKPAVRRIWEFWKRKPRDDEQPQSAFAPFPFDEAALTAVTDQLATQGVIVKTRMTSGEEVVVLQLPAVEQYAGALIVAARNNPRAPVLEERLLGSEHIPLPGIEDHVRLDRVQEKVVLECIVELMIRHGLCFRHGGLLVFPTLFPALAGGEEKLPHSVSLYYDFTGAIDNIYAGLVARLMMGEAFGEGRLRPGRVEFDRPGEGVCGIHQVKRGGGLARVDLFFAEETDRDRRDLFTRFVEEHLRANGVEIREHQAIKCRECRREITEDMLQANIAAGNKDVICPWCRTHTLISEGVARIRDRNPESEEKMVALRKRIDERMDEDVKSAKRAVAAEDRSPNIDGSDGESIRILHLSDLHFEEDTSPTASLEWLRQDLKKDERDFPAIHKVEYLVLSGDVTHQGDEAGFDKARQFVERLIEALELSALRCVLVPGNHDVQHRDSCYVYRSSVAGLDARRYVKEGKIYLVRDEADYLNRLKLFSDAFYHKVLSSQEYPLAPEKQGRAYFFEDTGVQFIALNTAWEVDRFYPKRAGIHPEALAHALRKADKQVWDAMEHRGLDKDKPRLRIAVFHHAVQGSWAMQDLAFLGNLQTAGVRLCLHGDVHEMRRECLEPWDKDRHLHVLGTGTFGSKRDTLNKGSARSYNLIEIAPDLTRARVYVREQPHWDGAWRGWNQFPDPEGGRGKVPFFDIDFKK